MSIFKRGKTWWYEFIFAGKRIRESSGSSRRTLAIEAEKQRRLELERALVGLPSDDRVKRIMAVKDITAPYLKHYSINHGPKSFQTCTSAIKNLDRILGNCLLPDLKENTILDYMKTRLEEEAAGRTINAELGELSRAMGYPWKLLWPRVRRLEERRDIGKALTPKQEAALIEAAELLAEGKQIQKIKRHGKTHEQARGPRGVMLPTMVRLALLTGMRSEELSSMQWSQIDLEEKTLTVGKAKTAAGTGRVIPMNGDAFFIVQSHLSWWAQNFGEAKPVLYVFPFGTPNPVDPTRPITTFKHSWQSIRDEAGVNCRWHDLRHPFCTKLAEAGTPESTMLALMGHMSRSMLERYSHIRMAAKREAVECVKLSKAQSMPEEKGNFAPAFRVGTFVGEPNQKTQ